MVHVLCMCCDCEVTLLDGLLQLHVMHKEWHVAVSMHPVSGFATECVACAGQSASKVSCIAMFTSFKVAV